MGSCCNKDQNTAEIDNYMNQQESNEKNITKLLFLGPGGSGKSTIFKMLQYIHDNGFSERQKRTFATHIRNQVVDQMKTALRTYYRREQQPQPPNNDPVTPSSADDTSPRTPPESPSQAPAQTQIQIVNVNSDSPVCITYDWEIMDKYAEIIMLNDDLRLNDESIEAIKYIWRHYQPIQNAFTFDYQSHTHKKVLDESSKYFWDDLDRITCADYVPNDTDILNVRARTIGIIEKRLEINDQHFLFVDVGGQKNERKKWIGAFDEVTAVIFVVSLSSYNENMFEDAETNCMVDSLQLFDEICNSEKAFKETDIILFLNKKDLFHEKIKDIPITESPAFTDFFEYSKTNHDVIHSNPNNYDQVVQYIQSKFHSKNLNNQRILHTHLTCALSKLNIKTVFDDVQQMIVNKRLHTSGLLRPA